MKICHAPNCKNQVIKTRHWCSKHIYRKNKYNSLEIPMTDPLPEGVVKICKYHGNLTIKEVCIQKSKYFICKKCRSISSTKWQKNNLDKVNHWKATSEFNRYYEHKKWVYIKSNYGITRTQYEEIDKKQNNVCAICLKPESIYDKRKNRIRTLSVDHCHLTNKIRGLLCGNCNRALGLFKDCPERLKKALIYLQAD